MVKNNNENGNNGNNEYENNENNENNENGSSNTVIYTDNDSENNDNDSENNDKAPPNSSITTTSQPTVVATQGSVKDRAEDYLLHAKKGSSHTAPSSLMQMPESPRSQPSDEFKFNFFPRNRNSMNKSASPINSGASDRNSSNSRR